MQDENKGKPSEPTPYKHPAEDFLRETREDRAKSAEKVRAMIYTPSLDREKARLAAQAAMQGRIDGGIIGQ